MPTDICGYIIGTTSQQASIKLFQCGKSLENSSLLCLCTIFTNKPALNLDYTPHSTILQHYSPDVHAQTKRNHRRRRKPTDQIPRDPPRQRARAQHHTTMTHTRHPESESSSQTRANKRPGPTDHKPAPQAAQSSQSHVPKFSRHAQPLKRTHTATRVERPAL